MDGPAFAAYIRHVLIPEIETGIAVILDLLVYNAYRLELEGQSFWKSAANTGDKTPSERQ